ncbi:MAG: hypothetical protein V7L23_03745 [Nostoc sp.]|uniref:hypothetical protein n=1 Tax=Nostoc sp. TaxID=1180 RepID=UPI002FF37AFC
MKLYIFAKQIHLTNLLYLKVFVDKSRREIGNRVLDNTQYCVGFGISWLRQAVLEQGEKWRLALSFASPASPAYPSSIGQHLLSITKNKTAN